MHAGHPLDKSIGLLGPPGHSGPPGGLCVFSIGWGGGGG